MLLLVGGATATNLPFQGVDTTCQLSIDSLKAYVRWYRFAIDPERLMHNRGTMNRRRYLVIGSSALVIGFLVSLIAYEKLQVIAALRESRIEVMVAAEDLRVGAKLEEHDIRIIKIAATDLPPGAPRRRTDVVGHGVILPIFKGEFILPNRLAGKDAGAGLASLIPRGMRAVSVRVDDVMSVNGFVRPGTRVDVLLTVTLPRGERQTTTVLQNVNVLASGPSLERDAVAEPQNTSVITLLIPLSDAPKLTLARSGMQHHEEIFFRANCQGHAARKRDRWNRALRFPVRSSPFRGFFCQPVPGLRASPRKLTFRYRAIFQILSVVRHTRAHELSSQDSRNLAIKL